MTPTDKAALYLAAARWSALHSSWQTMDGDAAAEALKTLLRVAREADPDVHALEQFRRNVNQHSDPVRADEKQRAERYGCFWLPCPNCGRWFGGHEPSGGSFWADPIHARMCCSQCPGQYGAAPLHQQQGPQGVLEARARAIVNHQAAQKRNR